VKVLFMCTANSCRSQIAEAWARSRFPVHWTVASCGLLTYPIAPETEAAMADAGIVMEGQYSKTLDQFELDEFDLVVTLSHSAASYLPALAEPQRHLHWPVADPMSATGSDAQVRAAFARCRDQIESLVAALAEESPVPPAPGG
jgi:arsenate reductase